MENTSQNLKWVRSENGAIAGVCKGLGQALDLPVGLTRLLLVGSVLFFGAGLGIYILLAIALPRRDRLDKAMEPKVLGVCAHFAKKSEIEIGLVRFVALLMLLAFSAVTLVGYFICYFVLPENGKSSVSRSNPSVPPSTT